MFFFQLNFFNHLNAHKARVIGEFGRYEDDTVRGNRERERGLICTLAISKENMFIILKGVSGAGEEEDMFNVGIIIARERARYLTERDDIHLHVN